MKFNNIKRRKKEKNFIDEYKNKIVFYYDYNVNSTISSNKIIINIEDLDDELKNIYKEVKFDHCISVQICASGFFKMNLNSFEVFDGFSFGDKNNYEVEKEKIINYFKHSEIREKIEGFLK